MMANKLYHICLCCLWVSGTFVCCNIHVLYAQGDSSAYYLEQLENYTDLALQNQEYYDSCIRVYKRYHRYELQNNQSAQGLKVVRSQVGKIIGAKAYTFAAELVDSMGTWVEPNWLDAKSVEDFEYLYIYNGFSCMKSNNSLSAIDAYEEALNIFQSRFGSLCRNENLGRCLLLENKATDYNKLWRFIYHPLVKLYKKIGDVDLAKLYLPNNEEILLIRQKQILSESHLTNIYMELVGSALAAKDTIKAYELSRKSYDLYPRYSFEKFEVLLNLANIERTLKKFNDTHSHLDQVIRYAETQIEHDKISMRLWRDGHLFKGYAYRDEALARLKKEPEKADELFEKSINEYDLLISLLSESIKNSSQDNEKFHKELIHLLHSRGDIGYYMQNYEEAETYYQEALSMVWKEKEASDPLPSIESLDLDWDLFYSLEGLGKIWYKKYLVDRQSVFLQKASKAYELVFAMEDSFRVRYPTQGSRQTQQKNSQKRLKKRMNIAYSLWGEERDEKSIQVALNIMDRSRALEMQAHLLGNSVEKDLNQNQKKLIDSISSIQEKLYELYLHEPEQNDIQDHQMRIQQVNEELLTYRNKLKQQNPTYYRLKYTPQISNLKELQKKIKKGEALINYYWGDKELYQLSIGHDFYDIIQYPLTEKFTEDIRFVTDFTKNARPTKKEQLIYQEAAYSLYEVLLGNVEGRKLEKLIIVPDGPIGHLAFEALLTKKVEANKVLDYRQLKYVFQKYLIHYQFVPHFLLKDGESAPLKEVPILYAGFAPTYDFNLVSNVSRAAMGNLAFNVHEVDSVFNLFSSYGANNRRFMDSAAREARFREVAPEAELLHVAMHALNNEDAETNSYVKDPYLLFSNQSAREGHDDRLFMREIYGLGLKADLMVLSACNTGTGAWGVSEGMLSLGRAFRMAGCKNIISSLWNVNDESSQIVIQAFYEFLLEGAGKAEALRKAKEAYLFSPQITNRKAAPYYWAQFVLMGDNTQLAMLEDQQKSYYMIWIGVLALAVLLGGAIYRKWGKQRG